MTSQDALDTDKRDTYTNTETDLCNLSRSYIRPLVELNDEVNKLTSNESTINSARIVVAGDQSHGKTSLLEALGGIDLPRGEGIQTRVPLILQLRDLSGEGDGENININGQFDDNNNKKDIDEDYALIKITSSTSQPERIALSDIGAKVRTYTKIAAGEGKDIRDEPIELKVYRKGQVDLTLIDLPGITRVALKDQAGGDGKKLEELILNMCERYMKPEESVILNVVSAMVDFSTSASLQLSRKVDPHGARTMLCVTKVDQHVDEGLRDKIEIASDVMGLRPDHVFAVRNRSQVQNDNNISLLKVRELETFDLQKLSLEGGNFPCFGLGIPSLSRRLVEIQHEQILKTLPQTSKAIVKQISCIQDQLVTLGEPMDDSGACRSKAVQIIESCVCQMEGEIEGRVTQQSIQQEGSCEGDAFEIRLKMDNFVAMQATNNSVERQVHEIVVQKGFKFQLQAYFKNMKLAVYLDVEPKSSNTMAKSMIIDYCIALESNDKCLKEKMTTSDFIESRIWGWSEFLSIEEVRKIKVPVTIVAYMFIKRLKLGDSLNMDSEKKGYMMLCAYLNHLQDNLAYNVSSLYSDKYFFSITFRQFLAHEVSACRGGVGLPGVISQHVPINVLKILCEKLPSVVSGYRNGVVKACIDKIREVVTQNIDPIQYRKLHDLITVECTSVFEKQASTLTDHHKLILEWEGSFASSNYYFIDTVKSVRENLSKPLENRPFHLKHLSDSIVAAMSSDDQRLVDMQIEIFAYWKLMKKRIVDYIILSTISDLVNKSIKKILKVSLLQAVLRCNDEQMVTLFSPDEQSTQKRIDLVHRLERLSKARDSIDRHKRLGLKLT